MSQQTWKKQRRTGKLLPALLCLLLCAWLLSACSQATTQKTSQTKPPALSPTPAISQSLQQQGQLALQAFQQWIDLLIILPAPRLSEGSREHYRR